MQCQVIAAPDPADPSLTSRVSSARIPGGGNCSDLVRPISSRGMGRCQPLLATTRVSGLRRAWSGLARDARKDPLVRLGRQQGRTTGARADRRRRAQRPVSPTRPRRSLAGSDASAMHSKSPGWSAICAKVSSRRQARMTPIGPTEEIGSLHGDGTPTRRRSTARNVSLPRALSVWSWLTALAALVGSRPDRRRELQQARRPMTKSLISAWQRVGGALATRLRSPGWALR